MNNRLPVWIDCDPGIDDAAALMTAVSLDSIDIRGISATYGNAHLEDTFRNAGSLLRFLGREDIRLYQGASRPLFCDAETAPHVHGNNGIGDIQLHESRAVKETETAWQAIYRTAMEEKGRLNLICTGPLTDLAIALVTYPVLPELVDHVWLMGGAAAGGNVTPCAEFNVFTDPDAAEIVFSSGIPIVMCGLDVTRKAVLPFTKLKELSEQGYERAVLLSRMSEHAVPFYQKKGINGVVLHDVCPILCMVHPELFTMAHCGVHVETQGHMTRGKTVCDLWSDQKFEDRHVDLVLDLDVDGFLEQVIEVLGK